MNDIIEVEVLDFMPELIKKYAPSEYTDLMFTVLGFNGYTYIQIPDIGKSKESI